MIGINNDPLTVFLTSHTLQFWQKTGTAINLATSLRRSKSFSIKYNKYIIKK